jgi:hypothetical protein
MTDTANILADLRNDHAKAEAEAVELEEKARAARERCTWLAETIHRLEEWTTERQKTAPPHSTRVEAAAEVAPRPLTSWALAAEILKEEGHPLSTRSLSEKMAAAGYTTTSHKPLVDAVYGTLTGALKVKDARLVKIGTEWGLREWIKEGGQQ